MSGTDTDYSKDAVRRRFARRHRGREESNRPLAWLLDGGVLTLSAVSLWYLLQSGIPAEGALAAVAMASLLPILGFVAARYLRPVPTPLGWIWLMLMGIALIALGAGFVT